MPEDAQDIPSSFTQIGHIAHMNLRENYYPWKKLIAQVILDVSLSKHFFSCHIKTHLLPRGIIEK